MLLQSFLKLLYISTLWFTKLFVYIYIYIYIYISIFFVKLLFILALWFILLCCCCLYLLLGFNTYLHTTVELNLNFSMSSSIFQYFNSSKNPKFTMLFCLVSDSTMFLTSYSSFSASKSPLNGTWSLELIFNPLEDLDAPTIQSPSNLQNAPLL